MAGQASNYIQDKIAGWIQGNAFPSAPANLYLALYTANPSNSGGGTEVTGGSYARQAIASSAWTNTGHSPEQLQNTNTITFPTATANWGTITAWGLFDASTSGNFITWNTLTASQAVNNGNTAQFAANALTVQVD